MTDQILDDWVLHSEPRIFVSMMEPIITVLARTLPGNIYEFNVSACQAALTSKSAMRNNKCNAQQQVFFQCPGAPKKKPKGQPNVICCVSSFDLCLNGVQGEPRWCPRKPKRVSRAFKKGPEGAQGGHGGGEAAGKWINSIYSM